MNNLVDFVLQNKYEKVKKLRNNLNQFKNLVN